MLEKLRKYQISIETMKFVTGGSVCSNCIASNRPACTAAGLSGGALDTCVITLRTECENQSFCQK